MTTEKDEASQSVADYLHDGDSPLSFCETCGEPVIDGFEGGHKCTPEKLELGNTRPTVAELEAIQRHDPNPADEIVGLSDSSCGRAYHRAVRIDDPQNLTLDPDATTDSAAIDDDEWTVVSGCDHRTSSGWTFTTRERAQNIERRYPCTFCHDLPIEQINEAIRSIRDGRYAGGGTP